jgi:PAS domain S-box-containing protein
MFMFHYFGFLSFYGTIRYEVKLSVKRTFFIIFFSLAVLTFSQDYLVHHYTESNGLPNSAVYDVTQDKPGRIWFATQGGIAVFDGVYWERFSVSQGLPVPSFFKIRVDSKNRVWAVSVPDETGVHLVFYDGVTWREIPQPPGKIKQFYSVTSFELMEHNREDKRKNQLTVVIGTREMGLFTWNGTQWKQLTKKDGLQSNRVNGLVGLGEKLFVATDNGLSVVTITPDRPAKVNNRLNELLKEALTSEPLINIKAINVERSDRFPNSSLKDHRVWLYGGQWLGYLEDIHFKTVFNRPGLNWPEIEYNLGIFPDYQNGLYINYLFQIFYFNCNTGVLELIGVNNGLIDEGATSTYIDYEKNVWVTCRRGVSKIASRRFGSFQTKHGLLENEVTAVVEYDPGKFVFGHNNGITLYNGTVFKPRPFRFQSDSRLMVHRVMDMKVDSKKNIWMTLSSDKLIKTNTRGHIEQYGEQDGLLHAANTIWIDPDDTLWVGTDKGLYTRKDHGFVPVKPGVLKTPSVRKIYKPSPDILYLATTGSGLYEYKDRRWSQYRHPNDPKANNIFAVIKDNHNNLFLGTRGGLFILKEGKIQRYVQGDFKIERTIYFIVEDNNHQFWFGTGNGVVRWDRQRKKTVVYSTTEGLIGLETNRAAGLVDSRGRVWIGTNRGVSVYNPSFDNINVYVPPPRVRLLTLEAPGKKISLEPAETLDTRYKLAYEENNIAFHFNGISFLDERGVRFQTKLEGFDNQWSEELYPYRQMVRYRSLPPGRYRFHLRVKNALGIWSEPVTSPVIVIQRPYYQQWWFYLLILVLAGIVSTGIYQYFYQKRHSARLAKEIARRTRQLRASEEKYARLFQEIKDVVYISSPEGKLIDMNSAGVELFGFTSKEEILNADIGNDLYANPQDREYFKKAIEEQGFVKDYELAVRRKNGGKFLVLLTATEVRDEEGRVVTYLGIMRDITERKKLEMQLERAQKMEAIGMLAGGVAHDLNNILTGLTSYPELLLMQIPEDSRLRKPLLTIKQTGEKAAAMVQDLLTLSRRGVEVREVINVNEVIRDYLESPEYEKLKAYHPDVQLDLDMARDLLNLLGSPIHLLKTLMNLVSNAVEAMPHGGNVCIKTENLYVDSFINGYDTILEGEYVVLSVIDTGVGISPEDISRIFEPFYTRKEMGRSGTGLGMSVVWATVKDHNGYIDIKTKKGKGTTVDLYFPVTRSEITKKSPAESIDKYRGNEKILIIDDVEEQREVASGILSQMGYQVAAVTSGEEAVEYIKHHSVDLLVIDMIMEQGIDGLETYRRIIRRRPGQKAIIVSGFSKTEKVKEMQRLGAGLYVKKPYTIEQFSRAIRNELDSNPKSMGHR